jgi:hypothetical protein
MPKFNAISGAKLKNCGSGITVFKSDQCPYVDGGVKEMMEVAEQVGLPMRIVDVRTCEEAQNSVHPYGTLCVVLDGRVLTYRPIGARGLLDYLSKEGRSVVEKANV